MEALSGEHGAKAEKRRNSESSGRFLLGTFLFGKRKVPRANATIDWLVTRTLNRRETTIKPMESHNA